MSTEKTPAELWVEALRSGEYRQARGHLCANGKFCCLGIACDLYQKRVGGLEVVQRNGYVSFGGNQYTLPRVVRDWLELRDDAGAMFGDEEHLGNKNDKGVPFPAIADLIESRPPGLFKE